MRTHFARPLRTWPVATRHRKERSPKTGSGLQRPGAPRAWGWLTEQGTTPRLQDGNGLAVAHILAVPDREVCARTDEGDGGIQPELQIDVGVAATGCEIGSVACLCKGTNHRCRFVESKQHRRCTGSRQSECLG